jgi:putative transcriptional regulator
MIRILTWLAFLAWLLPVAANADEVPARGKLLVATEVVHGELFAKTVVLLLFYDETGAFGLVVNRPTEVKPEELLADEDAIAGYSGTLFWGGPVQMDSLRALLLTDEPPEGAEKIVDSVYLVSYEDALEGVPKDPDRMRFYLGYAGWAPGQLDNEMARGSWRIVPGSSGLVFAKDPGTLWKRMTPPQEQRASIASTWRASR